MRPIDADALVNRIVFHIDMPSEYKEQVEDMISDMPTIEHIGYSDTLRPKGKWIRHTIGHVQIPWGSDCSKCGEWFVVGEEIVKKYNYCPNCGALMEGADNETD